MSICLFCTLLHCFLLHCTLLYIIYFTELYCTIKSFLLYFTLLYREHNIFAIQLFRRAGQPYLHCTTHHAANCSIHYSARSTAHCKQACCAGCRRRPFTDEAPSIGKIHLFSKIIVTFEPVMQFGFPSRFRISKKL